MKGQWIKETQQNTIVIFVHGILSSSESCWTNKNGTIWFDLLKEEIELKDLGIYTFSYNTGIFSGTYSLSDVVTALKEQLKLDKVLQPNKQLIFVCHSMGGIVVRKFIVERQTDLINLNLEIGLFLVASPSLGSDYANLINGFAKILNHTQADALRFSQNNIWLNGLDTEFFNFKEAKHLPLIGKELIEDKPIILKKFLKKQIVEPFSGARYFGEHFKVANSDHSSIAKPENNQAIQHRLLCEFIKEFDANIKNNFPKQTESESKLMSLDSTPEVDIYPFLKPTTAFEDEQIFPIVGWDTWGNIAITGNPTQQKITITGSFQSAAGYVIERDLDFSGKILILNIVGSDNTKLDHFKLFKLEANDRALYPREKERKNLDDPDCINSGDGSVSFLLPSPLKKLGFVFWNATIDALTISGVLRTHDKNSELQKNVNIEHQLVSPVKLPNNPSALKIWQEKLDYLLIEEAKNADPARGFQLKKAIEEARQKIKELEE